VKSSPPVRSPAVTRHSMPTGRHIAHAHLLRAGAKSSDPGSIRITTLPEQRRNPPRGQTPLHRTSGRPRRRRAHARCGRPAQAPGADVRTPAFPGRKQACRTALEEELAKLSLMRRGRPDRSSLVCRVRDRIAAQNSGGEGDGVCGVGGERAPWRRLVDEWLCGALPPGDGAAQRDPCGCARQDRQPEREPAVGQHGDDC
jgi:hypothetical protein